MADAPRPTVMPVGVRFDERRQWLLPQGVVARDLANHPLFARPKKDATSRSYAVAFDELGGNTVLGMHMSRLAPGARNRGHRHLDEALIHIVSGRGWSELRQAEDAPMQRVEWRAGDILAIPANAWHQHFNADDAASARMLAFKNTSLLKGLFKDRKLVYDSTFRFHDRYDDEADYWTRSRTARDGRTELNVLHSLATVPLEEDASLGRRAAGRRYRLGGHRTLELLLVELGHRGHLRRHRPLAEEAALVLTGRGRTTITAEDGRETTVRWRAGDLVVAPLGCFRQHLSEDRGPTRLAIVRLDAFERAFAMDGASLSDAVPDRFPDLVEPDYSSAATHSTPTA